MNIVLKVVQLCVIILSALIHLSFGLFERCDETYRLETNENITITSNLTLKAKNVSSCRYTIIAPLNYRLKLHCILKFDQENSTFCPTKRFFVSVDGLKHLYRAHNFCNKNGMERVIKRRSVMNRLVMAYVSKRDLEDETFTCTASRVSSTCDCGWSRRVCVLIYFFTAACNFL